MKNLIWSILVLLMYTANVEGVSFTSLLNKATDKKNTNMNNILSNPGFEEGSIDDWLWDWGYPWYVNTEAAHSGTYGAYNTIADISYYEYWSQLYQEFTAEEGMNCKMSGWVKPIFNENAETARAGIMIQWINADDELINEKKAELDKNTTDWTYLTLQDTAPKNTAKVRFNFYIYGHLDSDPDVIGCKVYVDDAAAIIGIPSSPSNLTAKVIPNSYIELNWQDNSDNELGFEIWRRMQNENYTCIGTVASNVTTYQDTNIIWNPPATYFYKVRAYNNYGYSDYSNEAEATTTSYIKHIFYSDV
jgi:hypothetical protein